MILRSRPYFGKKGGVTFSGGEPLMQAGFVSEVAREIKKEGIHTAIDTSCGIINGEIKNLYTLADLVIADLKFFTGRMYDEYCKADIFDTVIESLDYLDGIKKPVILRTVIVPGINDTKECIDRYFDLIKNYSNIERYELKAFHTMGFSKYSELKIPNPLESTPALSEQRLEELKVYLKGKTGL